MLNFDIYDALDKEPDEEWISRLAERIAKVIATRIGEFKRSKELRLSMIGRCKRYIWYHAKGYEPEPLHPAVRLKFLFGDIIEQLLIGLIELSGHEVTDCQKEVELNGIKGHIDCLIDGQLYDIKSVSSRSFEKFVRGLLHRDDPFGYYAQLAAYAEALGMEPAGWIIMDKQLGHVAVVEAKYEYLPNAKEIVNELKQIVQQDDPPERPYEPVPEGKSGNMKLPTECSYCAYKWHCWADANNGFGPRVFLYSKGPVFLVKVVKEPNVKEITQQCKNGV